MFVYELSGCGFESRCSHLIFRYGACFEQGVPWHSGNCRVWIRSQTRTWHDKNIQTFRVISNEMPVLLLVLCWCYFSCLKMYSEKFFNAFISKCFLKSLWQRETQVSFFWNIITLTVKFSLTNLHISWRSWF